jgi:hypothetical protein
MASPTTLLALILLSLNLVPSTTMPARKPGLNSVFVALQGSPWTMSRWTTLVADLTAINVNNIIIADAVTDSTAWYPTSNPELKYEGVDVLEMALTAADAGNFSVYMGMLLPANWFHNGAMNVTYLKQLTVRVNGIATELHSLYGEQHQSLQGFYHAAEVYSTCCESTTTRCNATHVEALGSMLEPTGQLVHQLNPKYKYVLAPFANNVSSAETGWWHELLGLTPSVDVVAFQDGVGVSQGKPIHRSPQQASELIRAVSEALPVGMEMWTDIEIFSKLSTGNGTRYLVAPTARFLEQLELEAPFVHGQTIWEFTHFMDPHGCPGVLQKDCLRLYNDYKRYVGVAGNQDLRS